MKNFRILLFLALALFWSCKKETIQESAVSVCAQKIDNLKINQLQYLNSHNSYRIQTYQPLYDFMDKALGIFSKYKQPAYWDYSHEPLEVQFDAYHIRSLELDVYHDSEGGHFYHRQGNRKRNLIQRMIEGSNAQRLAKQVDVPLLVLKGAAFAPTKWETVVDEEPAPLWERD